MLIITLAAVILLALKSGALLSLLLPDDKKTDNGTVAVKILTQDVANTSSSRNFGAVGTGRARLSADIYPAVAEEVEKVLFEAQQRVKKGEVLVQLDDREEKLAIRLAEVRRKDARSLMQRFEQAVKEGAVPQSEVDTARANYEAAQVALEQARLALEERQIMAPFEGYVGIPNVDPGDRVDSTTLITGLDARDVLYIDFEVPEALAGALHQAQKADASISATTPSFTDRTFSGTITAQESRVDPQRRTVMARASIENKEDLLRPGMSFTVKWEIPGEKYPTVPEIALQWGREGSFVWIVRDGKAEQVMARVVARRGGQVLLEGEFNVGEAVVVEGVQRLRPDAPVELLESTAK